MAYEELKHQRISNDNYWFSRTNDHIRKTFGKTEEARRPYIGSKDYYEDLKKDETTAEVYNYHISMYKYGFWSIQTWKIRLPIALKSTIITQIFQCGPWVLGFTWLLEIFVVWLRWALSEKPRRNR